MPRQPGFSSTNLPEDDPAILMLSWRGTPSNGSSTRRVVFSIPRNLPHLNHDVANFSSLPLPTQNDAFAAEWQRYCCVEHVFSSDLASLWDFLAKHVGVLADCTKYLIPVPVTAADVEPVPLWKTSLFGLS